MGYSYYLKASSQEQSLKIYNFLINNYKHLKDIFISYKNFEEYYMLSMGNDIDYAISDKNIVGFNYSMLYGMERIHVFGIVEIMSKLTNSVVYYDHEINSEKNNILLIDEEFNISLNGKNRDVELSFMEHDWDYEIKAKEAFDNFILPDFERLKIQWQKENTKQ